MPDPVILLNYQVAPMTSRTVIAGMTGLIGCNLAERRVAWGWEVHSIARKAQFTLPGVRPIAAVLLDPEALRSSLSSVAPTHVTTTEKKHG